MRRFCEIGGEELGFGCVLFAWSPRGNLLAVVGSKSEVYVHDRGGLLLHEIAIENTTQNNDRPMSCACQFLKWDSLGENLAITTSTSSAVLLWNYSTKEVTTIQLGSKAGMPSAIAWPRGKSLLAVGTTKGAAFVYNHQQKRKILFETKHTKAITAVEWLDNERFVLASEDKQISLNCATTRECLSTINFKQQITELRCFIQPKKPVGVQNYFQYQYLVSVVGLRSIESQSAVLDSGDGNGLSLGTGVEEVLTAEGNSLFERHLWLDTSTLLATLQSGRFLRVSTSEKHAKTMSENVLQDEICSISYTPNGCKLAVASETEIKVLKLSEKFTIVSSETIAHDASDLIHQVHWTSDGQVLTVSTKSGRLLSFLSELPLLCDVWMHHVLYLTSLMQMDIVDFSKGNKSIRFRTSVEPTKCAIGPNHVVIALQNKAWFYHYTEELSSSPVEMGSLKYNATIEEIRVTENCVFFLSEKRVIAHHLSGLDLPNGEFYLPEKTKSEDEILCFDANRVFCVIGTRNGGLVFHRNSDFKEFFAYKHCLGILSLKPQPNGVRVVFVDLSRMISVLNPVTNHCSSVQLTNTVQPKLYWDWLDPLCFGICSDCSFHPFIMATSCQQEEFAQSLTVQEIPRSYTPVSLNDRQIYVQHKNGSLDRLMLRAKECLKGFDNLMKEPDQESDEEKAKSTFFELIQLGRLHDARYLGTKFRNASWLESLGKRCLQSMDVPLAIEVYRDLKSPAMIQRLAGIANIEEQNLLAAELLVVLGIDLEKAKELFLGSSRPVKAVDLLEDLESWEEAEITAREVAPNRVPKILYSNAQQLERDAKHLQALEHYNNALDEFLILTGKTEDEGFAKCCKAGAARMLLHLGQLVEAKALFQEFDDQDLLRSCAEILEAKKLLNEAASMYERCGLTRKAASLYITANNLSKAEPLVHILSDAETYKAFAKAKEQGKQFDDALEAYKLSGSSIDVIRVLLECKNTPEEAFQHLRQNYEEDTCKVIQNYCKKHFFLKEYMEFSLMLNDFKSAFEAAKSHELLLELKGHLKKDAEKDWWRTLGESIKQYGDSENSGDCYAAAGEPDLAIDLYIESGPNTLKKCLEVVQKSENKEITQKVLDWVLSLDHGVVESTDSLFLFELQLAMGHHETAIEFTKKQALSEQFSGNYGVAHKILCGVCIKLKKSEIHIPSSLYNSTVLLHSYILARKHLEKDSSRLAAMLLIRVSKSISAFPAHSAGILTSAVITCQRMNYKKSAIELAMIAVQPEHRAQLASEYRRKIETLVRKHDRDAVDPEDTKVPCVYCGHMGNEMELECHNCSSEIPFCVATGMRVINGDLSRCPGCSFYCRYSIMKELTICPFCNFKFDPKQLTLIDSL